MCFYITAHCWMVDIYLIDNPDAACWAQERDSIYYLKTVLVNILQIFYIYRKFFISSHHHHHRLHSALKYLFCWQDQILFCFSSVCFYRVYGFMSQQKPHRSAIKSVNTAAEQLIHFGLWMYMKKKTSVTDGDRNIWHKCVDVWNK